MARRLAIQFHLPNGGHVAVLRKRGTGQHLLYKIDYGVAAGTKTSYNFKFHCWLLVIVRAGRGGIGAHGNKTKGLALKKGAFTYGIAWRENILDKRRTERAVA
jgi:hypothetical protein